MIVEFQAFRLFLGAARLVAITPEPGMFYLRQERLQVAVRMVWHRALVPVLEFCAYHCRGDRDLFARYGECGSLHSAQARRSCLSDLACVKTWTEAKIVDPIGVKIVGLGRAFWRGIIVEVLNPNTDAFFSPSPRIY